MGDAERLASFGEALDAIKKRIKAEMGDEDVRYVKRLNTFSRAMELVGRGLIHFSFDPVTFSVGVASLFVHKQLQATEIGHTVLHGAYDRLEGAEGFNSKTFYWDIPIDEASWHRGHNIAHHQYTNIAGKDPDIHFGSVRLTEHTPHNWAHYFQLPITFLASFPSFAFVMNLHFTGWVDYFQGNGRPEKFDFIEDRSWATFRDVHKRALRKFVPYYFMEYVFFPLLAGPFFWKVMLGNWLAGLMRDLYSAATIFCGHIGEEVAAYPEGTQAQGRGQWYAMQVESASNFRVAWPFNILCGGLDLQIEHHLFPKMPPHRLRQIAPEVQALCEAHGVIYRREPWGRVLAKSIRYIGKLSTKGRGLLSGVRNVAATMT